jgi:hypothetical protein
LDLGANADIFPVFNDREADLIYLFLAVARD